MSEEEMDVRTVEHSIPIDILDDILTRFLIFIPESQKQNLIRICFQIELAHWFYLDFYVGNDPKLKTCTIYEFAAHVFQHMPYLRNDIDKLPQILSEWKEYKQSVPTYGAIILSEDLTHVLLVQSYWAKSSWGFPKGKVNEGEDPAHCAIREVLEETSFDISPFIQPDEFLESTINDQLVRLYIIKNVPLTTTFKPKTRYEIKACNWFALADLPLHKKDSTPRIKIGVNASSFFMVVPFVKRIRQICNNLTRRNRNKSSSLSESDVINKYKPKCQNKTESEDIKQIKKKPNQEKRHSKRQLFVANECRKEQFGAPSWLNFKFDMTALMECMP